MILQYNCTISYACKPLLSDILVYQQTTLFFTKTTFFFLEDFALFMSLSQCFLVVSFQK